MLYYGRIIVVTGWQSFANLADLLRASYKANGYPPFTSGILASQVGLALNIAQGAILLIAILVSVRRILAGRNAVRVAIVGGMLAAIVVIVGLLVVIMQDPALAEYVQRTTTP
jgi:hypothetical protein